MRGDELSELLPEKPIAFGRTAEIYGRLTGFSASAVELLEEARLILPPGIPGN